MRKYLVTECCSTHRDLSNGVKITSTMVHMWKLCFPQVDLPYQPPWHLVDTMLASITLTRGASHLWTFKNILEGPNIITN